MNQVTSEMPEVVDRRILSYWQLAEWADRILECAGVGVTLVDRMGRCVYYNKWAKDHLDRKPEYIGAEIYNRHRKAITNPRFDAMLRLFEEGRMEPLTYVARPYDETTIVVTVSPIYVEGELVGYSQIVLLKEELEATLQRFDLSGRKSFGRDMFPDFKPQSCD
ncbi:PAS domain-containing protein [Paraburkholderia sp. SIMBA_049]